ncbi:MAG: hypothetical protein EAZ95_05185 [Bacteroidetes bacterium]|nr:MAG: hypothetical protein EAZ95_05185 [Bacteroidota bacterium]
MEAQQRLEEFWSYSLEKEGLDSYLLGVYPENHPNFEDYKLKMAEWTIIYQSAKINGLAERNLKGFLEIKFS